jgi:membrane protease YdiL (CAAX protease family)
MKTAFDISRDQFTIGKQLWLHFYMGIAIIFVYILISPYIIEAGYPGLWALLIVELFVLAPIGMGHLFKEGWRINKLWSLRNVVYFTKRLSIKQYLKWSVIGILGCLVLYIPMYPVGLFLRESVFSWLPEWFFNPSMGTDNVDLIAKMFLAGIFIDGIVGPVVEELFFRGYLLPRMAYLKKWAPIVNGLLFGLYHFWQPHNYVAIIGVGIILSYIVWRKKNVYLGIIIHCVINLAGAIGGYVAANSGEMILR